MKPSPQASIERAIVSGAHSILTPSAASTSAEPEREEIERLPCLATGTPAPATTKAAQVEILCVPLASPPVPQVSIAPSGARTFTARALRARAAPAISSTVSPRTRSPIRNAPISASVAAPDMMRPKDFGGFLLGELFAVRHFAKDSAEIRKVCHARARGARAHRPLLVARGRARAARRGRGRESSQAADGRAPRRCSRDGTARHERGNACAGDP